MWPFGKMVGHSAMSVAIRNVVILDSQGKVKARSRQHTLARNQHPPDERMMPRKLADAGTDAQTKDATGPACYPAPSIF
jgi:hypothetical protein